jgi:hypothetical protein
MKLGVSLAGALALCCAPEDVTIVTRRESSGENAAAYAEGRVPLPECASFDYGRCDIAERGCVQKLGGIARCLHGSDPSLPIPEVSFWSEAETEADFLAELRASPAPALDHLEAGLARFGLTELGALEPEVTAARLARELTAYYDQARRDIAIVEHETRSDPLVENAIVVHEMIHAFQDSEHDLGAFDERYRRGVDANLRGASVIEGEARMHERRFFAALAGLDVSQIDLDRSFANLTRNTERWLWSQADLFTASQLGAPYGHGAQYVYGVWAEGGQGSVRALFETPPASMQEILAAVWGGEVASELQRFAAPASPAPSGLALETWTAMGAWGVYLLAGRNATDLGIAERLALDWRGDLLEIFSFDESETAARWRIRFARTEAADALLALIADEPLFEAASRGGVVTLRAATALPPEGL